MLKISFEADQRLKQFVKAPREQKPRYNWGKVFGEDRPNLPHLKIAVKGEDREFDVTEIADTVGVALTDLLLSREENEIFTEKNQAFVAEIATMVAGRLAIVIRENGARATSIMQVLRERPCTRRPRKTKTSRIIKSTRSIKSHC